MIIPSVTNEYSLIKKVVLGISTDFGGCPTISEAYDPKSKYHISNNTFPIESDIKKELNTFKSILETYGITVLRPNNIFNCNQVFARDVGFVVENKFFISNMIHKRSEEILGFDLLLKEINSSFIYEIPNDIFVEGGDVLVHNDYLFVGYSEDSDFNNYEVARTNKNVFPFLKSHFPEKNVIGFELNKSDHNQYDNCLHLDCCFQPLGMGHVILYPDGFKNKKDLDLITNIFGKENLIVIDKKEMSDMFSNIFSISNNTIVSSIEFKRLNQLLVSNGYIVEEIPFSEISKMGGLFRCTTLPLERQYE